MAAGESEENGAAVEYAEGVDSSLNWTTSSGNSWLPAA